MEISLFPTAPVLLKGRMPRVLNINEPELDFAHAASVCVVSPKGKITRYLNGIYFLPFDFKMAIIESSKGMSAPTISKIMQYCFLIRSCRSGVCTQCDQNFRNIDSCFSPWYFFLVLIFKPKRKK